MLRCLVSDCQRTHAVSGMRCAGINMEGLRELNKLLFFYSFSSDD